jgi:hypothetical protein
MSYEIYCDLDGVLVDFNQGFLELTGEDLKKYEGSYKQFTEEDWAKVDERGVDFWAELDWTNDGIILWNFIHKFKPKILSSPSRSSSSRIGKTLWCNRLKPHMSELILKPRHEKQTEAGPGRILIDDLKQTIGEWNDRGGIGIHHVSAINTIRELRKLGI